MNDTTSFLFLICIFIGIIIVLITSKTTVQKRKGILNFVQFSYTHSRYSSSIYAEYSLDDLMITQYLGSVSFMEEDERELIKLKKNITTDYTIEYKQDFFHKKPFIYSIFIQELNYTYYPIR